MHSIYLHENEIKALSKNVFEGCEQLTLLDLSYNKLNSLPTLVGASNTVTQLRLMVNHFYKFPNFKDFPKLTFVNLSENIITSVSQDTLPATMRRSILDKNPIECLSEHCWTTSQHWLNRLSTVCPDGKTLREVDSEVLCQGNQIEI